jgi:hypothetical protein
MRYAFAGRRSRFPMPLRLPVLPVDAVPRAVHLAAMILVS